MVVSRTHSTPKINLAEICKEQRTQNLLFAWPTKDDWFNHQWSVVDAMQIYAAICIAFFLAALVAP